MKFLKEFDFLSQQVSLTINDKGDTKHKTIIGGLISVLAILFSTLTCFFFILRMLMRKDISIINSTEINHFVNLTDSHKLPFLFKLSDTNSLNYKEDERLYYITMSVWFGGSNDSSLIGNAPQYKQSLEVSKCNLNKHFDSKFIKYFENINDIHTYYCIEPRNYSQTIYGLYGNHYPFSYYSFTLRYCANTTQNKNFCYSLNDIKEKFATPYLDFIFLDYTIDSLDTNIEKISVRKERFELSAKLYKRIYIYLEHIKYVIDNGFIFTHNNYKYFHRYNSIKIDTNIYDTPVIATLSIMNSINTSIFYKKYTKIQDYLATIGGIIKVISLIGSILNHYNAKNSYYFKIVNEFIIKNDIFNYHKTKKNLFHSPSTKLVRTKLNLSNNHSEVSEINANNNNKIKFNKDETLIHIRKFSNNILPNFLIKKKEKLILNLYIEFINKRLNLINVLKKLEYLPEIEVKKYDRNISNRNHGIKIVNKKFNDYDLESQ